METRTCENCAAVFRTANQSKFCFGCHLHRIAGGFDDTRFERDYFHGIRDDGVMVLLYHDLASSHWHLAGWWD